MGKSQEDVGRCGHPRFYTILEDLAKLHSDKNHDYAADGDPFGNFTRVADILSNYPDLDLSDPAVIAMIYSLKQLDAALWMLSNGHNPKVEGIPSRLKDVAVYSLIAAIMEEEWDAEDMAAMNKPEPPHWISLNEPNQEKLREKHDEGRAFDAAVEEYWTADRVAKSY